MTEKQNKRHCERSEAIQKKSDCHAIARSDRKTNEREAAKLFIESIKYLNRFMNIPTKLSGIKKEDIAELSKRADKEANPVYPVPVLMDREKLEGFYYDIMEEPINALEEIMKRAIKQSKTEEKELALR